MTHGVKSVVQVMVMGSSFNSYTEYDGEAAKVKSLLPEETYETIKYITHTYIKPCDT